jgi:hypothetical protein
MTSAQLATAVSDETGSGVLVFATSPTLVTPTLGVASATTINKVTLTAPATGSTLTIADGKPGNPIYQVLLKPEWKNDLRRNLLIFFENPNSNNIRVNFLEDEIEALYQSLTPPTPEKIIPPVAVVQNETANKPLLESNIKSPYLKHQRSLELPSFALKLAASIPSLVEQQPLFQYFLDPQLQDL